MKRKHSFTMTHGFYSGMGGFTINVKELQADGDIFLPIDGRLTLTARGTNLLAQCGHLPDIDYRDIKDKSKADGIAKALVLIQACWMLFQVIGRLVVKLPVTLLEVNTLGHVLCAFIIYLLWWNKPRGIREPTKLEGDWLKPICAYMYMSSQISGIGEPQNDLLSYVRLKTAWKTPELELLDFFTPKSHIQSQKNSKTEANVQVESAASLSGSELSTPLTHRSASLSISNNHPALHRNPSSTEKRFRLRAERMEHDLDSPSGDLIKQRRWKLASEAVRRYPAIANDRFTARSRPDKDGDSKTWHQPIVEELVVLKVGNWPGRDLMRSVGGLVMGMVIWGATMVRSNAGTEISQ